jgi:hypothetical protein
VGILFVIAALFFIGFNPLHQWVFTGSLFLGAILAVSGFPALLKLFSSGFRSENGLAVCLLMTASAFAALAMISLFLGEHIIEFYYVPHTPVNPALYVFEVGLLMLGFPRLS